MRGKLKILLCKHIPRSVIHPVGTSDGSDICADFTNILLKFYNGTFYTVVEPTYIGIFPVYLGMSMIFTNFQ